MSINTSLGLVEDIFVADEEVVFLTVDDVIQLHQEAIKQHSPGESLYVLSRNLLESAVLAPGQTFDGVHIYPTFTQMAAAYAWGLSLNHAFENGNKRVAFAACSTFLNMNGFRLNLSQDEATNLILGIVDHSLTRDDIAEVLNHAIEELY